MTARWQLCTYMDYSLSEDLFFLSFPRPHFCIVRHHRCETGNGLAFQFFFCWAVWLVGLGVGVYRGFPSTPPLALLGGVLWSTGNLLSVPAIKLIGLGLSLLIWGISNMCVGWASSTFGILGVEKQQVSKPVLNYAGAATALLALLVYLVRVFELIGPVGGTQRYPVIGPEGWFLVLGFVLASATALLVTAALTLVTAYRLTREL